MKSQSFRRAAALLTLIATPGFATAQPPSSNDQARNMIVKFKDMLPSVVPRLNDRRMSEARSFGYLNRNVMGHIQRLEMTHGFQARHGFSVVLNGFSARLTDAQIAQIRANPFVDKIEIDAPIFAVSQALPYGIKNVGATVSPAAMAGDGISNQTSALANVRAVVIDTGIATHVDLNVVDYVNYVGDGIDGDCQGHGTHVAGTIGAKDDATDVVGVAPGVPLLAIKVLDCNGSGSSSNLIKAFDYTANQAKTYPNLKYVANASLGFPTGTVISTVDTSIKNSVAAGVFVAVAAGNSADNTCQTVMVNLSSGTAATGVMAVSAVDSAYNEASFSSYGSCIAAWAPGVSILSTAKSGGTVTYSGTSMATPHVAGAATLVRAVSPELTAVQVDESLKTRAKNTGTLSKDGRAIKHLDVSTVGSSTTTTGSSIASASTSLVDFGAVKVRSNVSRSIGFTNSGTATMTLTGLSNLPAPVSVSSNNCSSIAVGASCSMSLKLNTSKVISFSSTVTTVGATTNVSFGVKGAVVR